MLSRTITISRRDLPHWQTNEGTYFVTFRFFDSLAADLARLLGRVGTFWQRESYDRLIRDEKEFVRANEYVVGNPEKAGLTGWKWVGRFDGRFVVRYREDEGQGGGPHYTAFARMTSA